MATTGKYTRVSRPSIFEIPEVYRNQLKNSKPSIFSKLAAFFVPIRLLTRVVVTLILTPFIGISYVILSIVVAIPSHIIRKIVSFIGHLVDGDLASLVTAKGTIPARDYRDWQTAPSQSITITVKLKGSFGSIEALREHILKSVVHRWNAKKDELEYPELQQYVTKRMGYLFFKWDRSFDISNHVNVFYSPDLLKDPYGTVVDEDKLTRIWETISRRPYLNKRSAWEILWVPKFHPDKNLTLEEYERLPKGEERNIIFLRIHHGYTDGISIYRFLLALTDHGLDMWEKENVERKVPKCLSLYMNLYGLFCGPYTLSKQLSGGLDFSNILHPSLSKHTGQYHIVRCNLPVSKIKNARRAHNEVSFHSVLIAGITGGIRHYFLKNGKGVPFMPIKMGIPVPKPGHSWKLRNDYLSSYVTLPVEKSTGRKRIYACEERLEALKNGALTPFLTQAITLIGGFPVECARFLTKKSDFTVLYSEMKGPNIPLKVKQDYELEDLFYSFGLGSDDLAVAFSSISYNGKINLILTVETGVCRDREKAEELMRLIEKEIEALQYGDCTNL